MQVIRVSERPPPLLSVCSRKTLLPSKTSLCLAGTRPGPACQTQGPQSGIKKRGFGLGSELRSLSPSLLPPCCSFNLGGEGRGGEVQSKYRIISYNWVCYIKDFVVRKHAFFFLFPQKNNHTDARTRRLAQPR